MDTETLIENFQALGEWEERYRYLIELGRKLPPLPESDHVDANKVRGCMSQVWFTHRINPGPRRRWNSRAIRMRISSRA